MEKTITPQFIRQSRFHQQKSKCESNDPRQAFLSHIQGVLGFSPPHIFPGKMIRFATNDKRGDSSGWAFLFDDATGGTFGCWRSDISETWQARKPRTEEERRAWAETIRHTREKAERELSEQRVQCRQKSAELWAQAHDVDPQHAYLIDKGIKGYGARQLQDSLLIPVRDCDGAMRGLQTIGTDGRKCFKQGTEMTAGHLLIGQPMDDVVLIAEGWATCCTLHEATGHAVVVAFNCGNLLPVCKVIREKYPSGRLIICADDDHETTGNPGVTKASEAAQAVGGQLVIPNFHGTVRGSGDSDFNDLALLAGHDVVKAQIDEAERYTSSHSMSGSLPIVRDSYEKDWPEPEPLPHGLLPVAEFSFELLPKTLQGWAQDICERVQCPPDFVAAGIMSSLGALIGRKVGIRPQARTDWTVTPNQWALVVGRPGVLKSPALEAALEPLKKLAAQSSKSYAFVQEEHKLALQVAKLRADNAEKTARSRLLSDPEADILALLAVESPEEPSLKRYMANDTTAAALGELMRQNQNGLLVFRDELVSLLRSLDREDQSEARGFYLTGWNGDSPYTFDRIGRGMNLHIPAICLSVLGGTQPGRLAEYVRQAVKGGAADDGLIQRFGLLVWPDTDGDWRNVDRWPNSDARNEAHKVFEQLDKLEPVKVEATQDVDYEGLPEGIPYLRFDASALGLFTEWRTELEVKLRSGELTPALESHFAKYRKLIPGLALILHLAEGNHGPVTERAALQALGWSEYLESHARRVYGSAPQATTETAKAILHRIRKGDLRLSFSSRDVWRPGWSKLADRVDVAEALQLLVDYDWLNEERSENTGGRPSKTYHVNPRWRMA